MSAFTRVGVVLALYPDPEVDPIFFVVESVERRIGFWSTLRLLLLGSNNHSAESIIDGLRHNQLLEDDGGFTISEAALWFNNRWRVASHLEALAVLAEDEPSDV